MSCRINIKRLHLFEILDQDWCPQVVRQALTDYLQFVSSAITPYAPTVPILAAALRRTGARRILDLGSGSAGPWFWLQPVLREMGLSLTVCLTDKYPNPKIVAELSHQSNQAINYHPKPVDATQVPGELTGFRTMFLVFHHFRPEEASAILTDAVRQRQAIAVFEATERSVVGFLVMLLAPLMVLVMTPFVRPFRWSRLVWTYLIPLVPLVTLFDGLVSSLRTYSEQELHELTAGIAAKDYQWEIGSLKNPKALVPFTYLIGVPS